jgi:hypothetical protein
MFRVQPENRQRSFRRRYLDVERTLEQSFDL